MLIFVPAETARNPSESSEFCSMLVCATRLYTVVFEPVCCILLVRESFGMTVFLLNCHLYGRYDLTTQSGGRTQYNQVIIDCLFCN